MPLIAPRTLARCHSSSFYYGAVVDAFLVIERSRVQTEISNNSGESSSSARLCSVLNYTILNSLGSERETSRRAAGTRDSWLQKGEILSWTFHVPA